MSPSLLSHWRWLLCALAALAVGALAISNQSFWMDEGGPAFKSMLPTLGSWWRFTLQIGGSDVQMPVYMPLVWLWEKIFGSTEFALRAINLPFLVIMVLALRRVPFWPLVCLTSPFVLYYVGELRPYAMQMAAGACAAAAFGRILRQPDEGFGGIHALFASALFLSACSLSAVVWAAGLVIGALVIRTEWLARKGFWLRAAAWVLPFMAIAGYYAFTLFKGYRGAPSAGGGLLSMLFGFYEMAGLLGIGPSRNELRDSAFASLMAHLPWLLPAAAILGTAWMIGVVDWLGSTPRRVIAGVTVAAVLPLLILAAVSVMADFRVLGRHMSPAIAAMLLPFCLCLAKAKASPPRLIAGALAILVMAFSSVSLRFAEKHARDDYRTATRIALDAFSKGHAVLWQADIATPLFYAYRAGGWDDFSRFQKMRAEMPATYMFADLVFINRPDFRRRGEDHRETMKREGFDLDTALPGFEVWKNRYASWD